MDTTRHKTRASRLYDMLLAGALAFSGFFFVSTLYHAAFAAPDSEETIQLPIAGGRASARPDFEFGTLEKPSIIAIPSLGINAEIIGVGVNSKGSMAVPKNYQEVGWYVLSAIPGNPGNAVLAGHVDNGFGLAGVFKDLSKIAAGSEISISDTAGATARFKVVRTKILSRDSTDTGDIFGPSERPMLVLITCDGSWISESKTYDKRFIVFAERVG